MSKLANFELQYISQGETPIDHLRNIGKVCEAGGRWIQLRLKKVAHEVYMDTAQKAREICDQYQATLLINDNIDVAKASKADGIHLGLTDSNPIEARKILGKEAIIGGTANTYQDCVQQIKNDVDYIGLGPFKFTSTKKNLSTVLGLEGYKEILEKLNSIESPVLVVAIGGIEMDDIVAIYRTKVSGIAVSGLLTHADEDALEEIIEIIKNTHSGAIA